MAVLRRVGIFALLKAAACLPDENPHEDALRRECHGPALHSGEVLVQMPLVVIGGRDAVHDIALVGDCADRNELRR